MGIDVKRVAVVGAGIIGLSVADALLAKGFEVVVVDREQVPGGGCSYGNGGMIVPSHFVPLAAPGMVGLGLRMMLDRRSPFGVQSLTDLQILGWMIRFMRSANRGHVERTGKLLCDLNLASKAIYERIIAEMGVDVGYTSRGMLMLSRTHEAHDAEAKLAAQAEQLGLRTRVLDEAGLRELEPELTMNVAGAVHFEDDAHFTPTPFMAAFRKRVESAGAEFLTGMEVREMSVRAGRIAGLVTDRGEVEADEYVLAAGVWSGALAGSIGLRMPMLAGKGYGMTVPNPPERPRLPAILTEARVAMTSMLNGVRFVGVLELSQPKVSPNLDRIEGIRRNIPQYYPAFTKLDAPVWCGLRPCSPDGLPYIGRTAKVANLTFASGHAMMGMSLGPITGKLVVEVLAGEETCYPLTLLSPDRYA